MQVILRDSKKNFQICKTFLREANNQNKSFKSSEKVQIHSI